MTEDSTGAGRPLDLGRWLKVLALVLAVSIVASFGLGVGSARDADTHVAVGDAYVTTTRGEVTVQGVAYAFAITDGMPWYDGQRLRTSGVPPCLAQRPTTARIRFGYATAHGPDDASWPVVTWVQCVGTA